MGCPIRISSDQRLLAPPQSFSQHATSFIASMRQGIHQMPLKRLISALLVMHRSQIRFVCPPQAPAGTSVPLGFPRIRSGGPSTLPRLRLGPVPYQFSKNRPLSIASASNKHINPTTVHYSYLKLNTTHGHSSHLEPEHPQLGCIHFLFTISNNNAKDLSLANRLRSISMFFSSIL